MSISSVPISKTVIAVAVALSLTACGGGGSGGNSNVQDPPINPTNPVEPSDPTDPDDPTDPPDPVDPVDPTDPSDPGDQANHVQHCGMVPAFADASLVTRSATQSGAWSDTSTWGGTLPGDGDVVRIPEGIEVTLATIVNERLKTLRVDGTLRFATDTNTALYLETLVSTCPGNIEIGTQANPLQNTVNAQVVFIDDGTVADDKLLSRGAILIGRTRIHGAAKTHRAIMSPQAAQGSSELQLTTAPSGWAVGDEIVITGTIPNAPDSDEIRRISAIEGRSVTLSAPLNLDHRAPRPDLNVYVANTTRNVEFSSENTRTKRRGHIMIMSSNTDIRYARFTELGRTDKTTPLNDFEFFFPDESAGDDAPATAELNPLFGTNIRGRYALHFHQISTNADTGAGHVQGSVVFNGPGWGFVNHSSHVNFIDNVSYGLQGAGFYTEAGDEIGTMRGNIAIRSVNRSFTTDFLGAIDPDLRANFMDYGNDGDGFWLTGNRVSLIDNVSAGASAHGIIYWTDGIMEPGERTATRVTVSVDSLPNSELIPGRDSVPVWWAPLAESRGNESYGATIGFRARYIHAKNYLGRDETTDFHRSPPQAYIDTLSPVFENLTVWGNRDGVLLNYNERVSLRDARIVGFGRSASRFRVNDGTAKTGVGLDVGTEATFGPASIENVTIEGFGAGFITPVNGLWQIDNMTLSDNGIDLYIQPEDTSPTRITLRNVTFASFEAVDEEGNELPEHIEVNAQ